MTVSALDAASSVEGAASHTYTVSAGSQRILVVGVTQEEGIDPVGAPSGVTYGGQAMTSTVTKSSTGSGNNVWVGLYILLESGIAAASGTTISVSGTTAGNTDICARSYAGAVQSNPTVTTSDTSTGGTPNPITLDITATAGGAVAALNQDRSSALTPTWGGSVPLTAQTSGSAGRSFSYADATNTAAGNVDGDCTWSASPARGAAVAMLIESAAALTGGSRRSLTGVGR